MPTAPPRVQIVKSDPPKNDPPSQEQNLGRSPVLKAFQRHHLALHRFISRFLYNRQDVEDVAQEAFLRAFSAEKSTNIEQPKSYLFRVAKNVAVSQLRLKSRQITSYIDDEEGDESLVGNWTLEDEVMARQKLGIHCEAVASLPPQCRKVYLLRKVHGLSHKNIAERLGITVSTVEKHLNRGVEQCDAYVSARMEETQNKPTNNVADIQRRSKKGGAS